MFREKSHQRIYCDSSFWATTSPSRLHLYYNDSTGVNFSIDPKSVAMKHEIGGEDPYDRIYRTH